MFNYVSIEGQGFFLALVQGQLHIKLKPAFLRNQWAILNQILYVSFGYKKIKI